MIFASFFLTGRTSFIFDAVVAECSGGDGGQPTRFCRLGPTLDLNPKKRRG
jgi:hypothetical protein